MATSVLMNGMMGTNRNQYIFGERRNHLTSMWDLLFGDQPKEWIGFKPTLGTHVYPCYACRHMFSSLSSLQDHVNRRIIVLKYNCSNCSNEDLTFYNRCALLLHARLHFTTEEGQINLSEINTFTLPLHLAGFLPVPNIPLIYEEDEAAIDLNVFTNVQFYVPAVNEKGKQTVILKPNDFVYREQNQTLVLKQICKNIPKCQFITLEEQRRLKEQSFLVDETDEPDTNIKLELFDYIDQLTLPVISKVESLHEKTYNIPRCLDCRSVQHGTMAEHYQDDNKPSDLGLTCPVCKFIASSKCSYKAHLRIHNGEAPHVCPDCGKDLESSETLQKHLDEVCFHLAKNVKFRCPGKRCGKLFASETNLAIHFMHHLRGEHTCSDCGWTLFDKKEVESHALNHSNQCTFSTVYICTTCNLGPLNEIETKDHVEVHTKGTLTGVYVFMCRLCRNYFRSTATFATHLLRCTNRQNADSGVSGDCESCRTKRGCESKKTLGYCWKNKRPAAKKVLVTKKYFCILCNEQIAFDKKMSHMKSCRYTRPMVLIRPLSDSYLRSYQKSRRSSESPKSEENGKKKRKRTFGCSRNRRSDKDTAPDLIAEGPMEFDGIYHCKLCDYQNAIRSDFHAHIRNHRDISTAYQCMECGECFVVKPSLIKHLLHFHNITDYQSYLSENDCYDVEAVKELETMMRLAPGESKEPVKDNQCRVCFEEFEDSVTLSKHLRVHGMAFILKNRK